METIDGDMIAQETKRKRKKEREAERVCQGTTIQNSDVPIVVIYVSLLDCSYSVGLREQQRIGEGQGK
jgi:hypothetical protein